MEGRGSGGNGGKGKVGVMEGRGRWGDVINKHAII